MGRLKGWDKEAPRRWVNRSSEADSGFIQIAIIVMKRLPRNKENGWKVKKKATSNTGRVKNNVLKETETKREAMKFAKKYMKED